MDNDIFHSITVARDDNGTGTTRVYHGSRAEMEALAAEHNIDEADESGWLKSIRLHPHDGRVWECEFKYDAPDDWKTIIGPEKGWGKRSCQLHGTTLSRPLETHPNYRTRWNHCLCAAPGTTALPSWYANAVNTLIPAADAERYLWCRNSTEAPRDANGRWKVLATPTKPGVDHWELVTYKIIETARFRTAARAGKMVAGTLNRIGTPSDTFGITGGNWKCDDAEVTWRSNFWVARLTWTSGGSSGWDPELYD